MAKPSSWFDMLSSVLLLLFLIYINAILAIGGTLFLICFFLYFVSDDANPLAVLAIAIIAVAQTAYAWRFVEYGLEYREEKRQGNQGANS